MKHCTITRKGITYNAEIIRETHITKGSGGLSYSCYLIKREVKSPFTNPFVVGVRCGDTTKEFSSFLHLNRAIVYYLDMLACYA